MANSRWDSLFYPYLCRCARPENNSQNYACGGSEIWRP